MTITARYVHTNLIARDWQMLARFYTELFGCQPAPPERDLGGAGLEAGPGIPGVRLRGIPSAAARLRRRRPDAGDLHLQPDGRSAPDRGQPASHSARSAFRQKGFRAVSSLSI